MTYYIYDLETFVNIFTCAVKEHGTDKRWLFEISERRNDQSNLLNFIQYLKHAGDSLVGFNNIHFDYPVLHHLLQSSSRTLTARDAYDKAQQIISTPWNNRFNHVVWPSDVWVDQIDLFKIHHFDNPARSTSLKVLEFNMRADTIADLPYDPHTPLTSNQMDELIAYNWNDVHETERFFDYSKEHIDFRVELSVRDGVNVMNYNDTKIGKDFFARELEKANPGCCYDRSSGKKEMRQTHRPTICLGDVIFDYVRFDNPEFQRIHKVLAGTTITSTRKEELGDISCVVNGFQFDFGLGGIHGSISNTTVQCTHPSECIIDLDVTSYYPTLAIANKVFPEHLSTVFCDINKKLFDERKQYSKKDARNKTIKLALNGTYGDSNNVYSPFYDPQYTMTITVNGQLLLCMLAERLMTISNLKLIQINTDGLTVKCIRDDLPAIKSTCQWWESITKLALEQAEYSRMFIRDVNNYVAEYTDGTLKSKGCYEHDYITGHLWNKDFSALVVPKAAEAHMVHGIPLREFIENHDDAFDFMLRAKVRRSDQLVISQPCQLWWNREHDEYVTTPFGQDYPEADFENVTNGLKKHIKLAHDQGVDAFIDTPLQGVTRYYVAKSGGYLFKLMPPTYGKTINRRNSLCAGWKVKECNDIRHAAPDINYDYYVQEAQKLLKPLENVI